MWKTKSQKFPIKAVIIVIVFIALIWFAHPLWCHHSFETVSKDEATCTESGVEYRRCKNCGLRREREPKPKGHDMKQDDMETEEVNGCVYGTSTSVCRNCGYKEIGEPEYLGTVQEYSAKAGVSVWLFTHGEWGTILLTDSAIVTYFENGDYYRVIGASYNVYSKSSSLIEAHVKLDKNNDSTVIFASIGGEVILDTEDGA